jgi:hypothetical protein
MSETTDPQDNTSHTLEALTHKWADCKQREITAKDDRLNVEKEFNGITADYPEEGNTKIAGMKIETGFSRKWDQEKLRALQHRIRDEFFPFKLEWKEDRAAARKIETDYPDLWLIIKAALTLTPSKPSFSTLPPPKE